MSSDEVAARFRADMARLLEAVLRVSAADRGRAIVDDWSLKDLLAHIAAWDRALTRGIDELLRGDRLSFAGQRDDEFNARAVAASRVTSLADVLAEARAANAVLVDRIVSLTNDEWRRSVPAHWRSGTPMTVASLFDYRYKGETHYAGHAREIEECLARPL